MAPLWQNFMFRDLLDGFIAFLLFPLFTALPGYVAAANLNLLSFRRQGTTDRAAIAVVLSVGFFPALLYLAGHFCGVAGMWALSGLFWAGAVVAALRDGSCRLKHHGQFAKLSIGACALGLFLIFTLSDLQWGRALLSSLAQFDHAKHVAVTAAVFRAGADGVNPFFHPGHDIGLFYYHFWHLVCSMVERVGSPWITARAAVLGSVPWAALSLIALIRLYLLSFQTQLPERSFRIALLLLPVSGLDIIPVTIYNVIFLVTHKGTGVAHVEGWNVQVTSWLGSMVWVPQHLAGLVACFTGVLLLRSRSEGKRRGAPLIVLAGLCFATGLGYSVWVTLACALGVVVWTIICVAEKRKSEARAFISAGIVAALVATPYALHLRSAAQVPLAPIVPYIREFLPLSRLLSSQSGLTQALGALIALPVNYFMEFGFYALAALMWGRDARRRRWQIETEEKFGVAFAASSLVIATFAKAVLSLNDLGFRGILPAQFFLLLCAVRMLHQAGVESPFRMLDYRPAMARVLLVCAIFGCMTTAWDWVGTRAGRLADNRITHSQPRLRYQLRLAYEFLRDTLPQSAITQHNPDVKKPHLPSGIYGERQVVASDWWQGPLLAIEPKAYERTARSIARIFKPHASVKEVKELALEYSISALVVDVLDPVWHDPGSWIWQMKPDFAQDSVRVFLMKSLQSEGSTKTQMHLVGHDAQ
jgi:hypothetical protein